MKKRFLAVVLTVMLVMLCASGRGNAAYGADTDIVLDDAGSPLIRVIDPGDGDSYTYMGYVYCPTVVDSSYKYLELTYTGDATALSELRIEILDGSGSKIGVFWFTENAEGNFITSDGTYCPAPTSDSQTVKIDLAASGIDMTRGGITAMHIHDTQGTGKIIISDARFTKGDTGAATPTPTAAPTTTPGATPTDTPDTPDTGVAFSGIVPMIICVIGGVFVVYCIAGRRVFTK